MFEIRGQDYNPCDDLTLGSCTTKDKWVEESIITDNSQKCQDYCEEKGCDIFQFDKLNGNCTLMNFDYRQDCLDIGLPKVF